MDARKIAPIDIEPATTGSPPRARESTAAAAAGEAPRTVENDNTNHRSTRALYRRASTGESTYFDANAHQDAANNFYADIAGLIQPHRLLVIVCLVFVLCLIFELLVLGLGQPGEKAINAIGASDILPPHPLFGMYVGAR